MNVSDVVQLIHIVNMHTVAPWLAKLEHVLFLAGLWLVTKKHIFLFTGFKKIINIIKHL